VRRWDPHIRLTDEEKWAFAYCWLTHWAHQHHVTNWEEEDTFGWIEGEPSQTLGMLRTKCGPLKGRHKWAAAHLIPIVNCASLLASTIVKEFIYGKKTTRKAGKKVRRGGAKARRS
jgi:hypothetical protein